MSRAPRRVGVGLTGVVSSVALLLTACAPAAQPGQDETWMRAPMPDGRTLLVQATDTVCSVSVRNVPAGRIRVSVTNGGSRVTEFQLLNEDEDVVGEVTDVSPGLTRDLVLDATAGEYVTLCRPGLTGPGLRSRLLVIHSVTDPTPTADDERLEARAATEYLLYVRRQSRQLVEETERFVDLYVAGRDDAARARYAPARQHWERIEVIGESMVDLSQRIDQREADVPTGREWVGWHRIEKDLWPPATHRALPRGQRQELGAQLIDDTRELHRRTARLTIDGREIGVQALALTEAASRKVAREDESWSHTDLWDVEANLQGARAAFDTARPVVALRRPALDARIDQSFRDVVAVLHRYRVDGEYVDYTSLTRDEIKALSDALHALSEPLSHLSVTMS